MNDEENLVSVLQSDVGRTLLVSINAKRAECDEEWKKIIANMHASPRGANGERYSRLIGELSEMYAILHHKLRA